MSSRGDGRVDRKNTGDRSQSESKVGSEREKLDTWQLKEGYIDG